MHRVPRTRSPQVCRGRLTTRICRMTAIVSLTLPSPAVEIKEASHVVMISHERLLNVFWGIHDPTAPNVSDEYRSVILFHTPEQEAAARASKEQLERAGRFINPILTEIAPAPTFSRTEEYHQRYFERR